MGLKPAYFVPLKDDDLKLLGSIAAVQSQFEWQMALAVKEALDLDTVTTAKLMGSTTIENKAGIWLGIITHKRADDQETVACATELAEALRLYVPIRNNLFHSAFVGLVFDPDGTVVEGGYSFGTCDMGNPGPPAAIKTRTLQQIPMDNAPYAYEMACYISILAAHVTQRVTWQSNSTWSGRLPQRPEAPPQAKFPTKIELRQQSSQE